MLQAYEVSATHAMGADLRYECLGGNTYRITLTVYRDCQGSNLNPSQNIMFSSASCGIASFIQQAPRVSLTELSPLCPAQQPSSTCNGGILPGVEEHVYELVYTLPANCPDWRIAWQLCCRNYAITNSVITPTTRIYIEAFLNNQVVSCNNSPYFTTAPVPYLCEGEPFNFNNGAIDPDGDSLVFELIDPRDYISAQPVNITYMPGFNATYPMATAPANTFNFDASSGQFSFIPNGLQQGIVSLLVKEYRNGVQIGSTMRDIQMIVITCNNQVPVVSPPVNVSGGQLNGNTFSVCAGNTLQFDISATDPDVLDILTFETTLASAVPGALFVSSGNNPITANFSWPTTLADTGNYFFTLEVEDNGCPFQAKQVVGFNIIVNSGEILPPQDIRVCPVLTSSIQLQATTTGPGTYSWSPGTGLSDSTIANPVATLTGPTSYLVTYQAPGDCPVIEPVNIMPEATITLDTDSFQICAGTSVQLNATLTVNGAPVPFTWTWDPPATLDNPFVGNPVATPATTTLYSVTASTLTCDYTANVLVVVDQAPTLNSIPPAQVCSGDSVQLQVTGNNLTSASFSWVPLIGLNDPALLSPIASPPTSTPYTITATNTCGQASQTVNVVVFPQLSTGYSLQDPDCAGSADGSISLSPLGGNGTPTYTWSPSVSSGPAATGLLQGLYTIVLSDAAGCTDTVQVTLTDPPVLNLAVSSLINASCAGGATGSITVSASGGTPGYQYSINGVTFVSNNTFTGLLPGTYTISVRDANGCITSTPPQTITDPSSPVNAVILNTLNTDCNNPLGAIEAGASGGTPGYVYSLDGVIFQPSNIFTGLFPGTYQVFVRDVSGCTDVVNATILQVAEPFAQIDTLINVTCAGGSDGSVLLSGYSGIPPYQYSLNGGPFGQLSSFSNLVAGQYTVFLQDSIGCRFSLVFTISEPPPVFAVADIQASPLCSGSDEGELLGLATGGTGPFTFSLNGGTFTSTPIFSNLTAGTYTLTAQDSLGCTGQQTVTLVEPTPVAGSLADSENIRCAGETNGWITLTATGGTPGYQYAFNGGSFVSQDSFAGLAAGTYFIRVQDRNGCRDSFQVSLTQPPLLTAAVTGLTDALCFGGASGTISVTASGGSQPYTYSYDTLTFSPAPTLAGLRAGDYAILVQDVRGCLAQLVATIGEPDEMIGDITVQPVSCYGDSNGYAAATVAGGTPGYTYRWDNGTTQSFANNLAPGNHFVVVTDQNGCQISISTEVLEPPQMVFDTTGATALLRCYGDRTGVAFAAASGGYPPLSYLWSNGVADSIASELGAGTYIIQVTDTSGCTIADTLTIGQPDSIRIVVVDIEEPFCAEANGVITVLASGGTPGYTYQWVTTPPQTGPVATGLMGTGTGPGYEVIVLDTLSCEQRLVIPLPNSGEPEADFFTDPPFQDTLVLPGQEMRFINQSTGAVAYLWDFGDGQLSDDENPVHFYDEPGTYTIVLVAFDGRNLCPDTAEVSFTFLPPGAIYVPNAFTPNGDGINDAFYPVGIGVVSVKVDIWDRWGVHLVTLNSMAERWDGSNRNGNQVQEGVYVFVIDALLNDGTKFHKDGTVTLFR
ncbi:MAG: gliding motility-associated C-terminal domain-containing protein [Bacteroidia bacterium]|nr:gliding motility-associated C-terminal domain-containing protein [Bacteroidia bacterium]